MQIDLLQHNAGPDTYYTSTFRNVLEDHMTYLRTHAKTQNLPINPSAAYKYESDLFGLLQHLSIPAHLHWLVMRMNDMTTPTQSTSALSKLIIPDLALVDRIRATHLTNKKMKN